MQPMTQALVSVGLFVLLLALVPFGLKWLQARTAAGGVGAGAASRVISAVAVGPHQRVVTVEVGPEGARVWLTLGVTAQAITCLHSAALDPSRPSTLAKTDQVPSTNL
ncbi:MAG: FliO/MopB family protein [Rhodoferax sp.]